MGLCSMLLLLLQEQIQPISMNTVGVMSTCSTPLITGGNYGSKYVVEGGKNVPPIPYSAVLFRNTNLLPGEYLVGILDYLFVGFNDLCVFVAVTVELFCNSPQCVA